MPSSVLRTLSQRYLNMQACDLVLMQVYLPLCCSWRTSAVPTSQHDPIGAQQAAFADSER